MMNVHTDWLEWISRSRFETTIGHGTLNFYSKYLLLFFYDFDDSFFFFFICSQSVLNIYFLVGLVPFLEIGLRSFIFIMCVYYAVATLYCCFARFNDNNGSPWKNCSRCN